MVHLWRVKRQGEDKRFAAHAKLNNRKLLFHGTRIPVSPLVPFVCKFKSYEHARNLQLNRLF